MDDQAPKQLFGKHECDLLTYQRGKGMQRGSPLHQGLRLGGPILRGIRLGRLRMRMVSCLLPAKRLRKSSHRDPTPQWSEQFPTGYLA